ncbi:UDP-N-acetylmuramoyl-L-alanine--D-glutamate ligase [Collinsella sp. AGMB00827]|uniref:UDP-N-acetylmuramoylalanine--D-glutamate ligase n=1 Tax=Collinsella ureilytica TaxID=2869515 RepID=A0ABS7MHV0_9ACTN|nr:UDP-N-acetylmuramoyl-L-alanine--D-glutamate ligase [Collinsella urealyticum]MBY4796936.1 UDP-N-acetylmuramoyl-L-alanine--D-glutamate ligase [Collinsella urealyticum]
MCAKEPFSLLILGQGSTGSALASWALKHRPERVSSVTVMGGASSLPNATTRELEAAGVSFIYGTDEVVGSYDLCVASPGISEFSPFFLSARAASQEIMGEPEFAYRLSPEHWCAITGTNGKTTTTALIAHLLQASNIAHDTVGNIGDPCISRVDERAEQSWFVAELSSFQLATTHDLRPRVGILLNIAPDHLSWHRTQEAYARAKLRMFANMEGDDLCIVCDDDPGITAFLEAGALGDRRVCHVSMLDTGSPEAAFVRGGVLTVRLAGEEIRLVRPEELKIPGTHNTLNALAAAAAALYVGADEECVRQGLCEFAPLEHRLEPAGEAAGVFYINDSKATNTDAVICALQALAAERTIVLLGGRDKGGPLEAFADTVAQSVVAAVCFGEARERIRRALEAAQGSESIDIAEAADLRDAVDVARSLAHPGDTILLSPACSSFDEFQSFEERGSAFKAYVAELAAADEG